MFIENNLGTHLDTVDDALDTAHVHISGTDLPVGTVNLPHAQCVAENKPNVII